MPKKPVLIFAAAFGLLAIVLIFLGVNYVPSISAAVSNDNNNLAVGIPVIPKSINYAGSDWIERHPISPIQLSALAGSDWIERHPSNHLINSDWIERHPVFSTQLSALAGSDWIERHPSNYLTNSDWVERHP
jgi:hypothetical protein